MLPAWTLVVGSCLSVCDLIHGRAAPLRVILLYADNMQVVNLREVEGLAQSGI